MISVTILTKDSARHLRQVLESVRSFAEVLVLDTGSTDDTLAIAAGFPNVTIRRTELKGFGPLHNEASGLARHDWILSLDSDEVISDELAREIAATPLDEGAVYSFPFQNYYNGKWIRCCGWHPDRHARLYHRKRTSFTDAAVHEGIRCEGMKTVELSSPVRHYSYGSVSDFLSKMQRYSDLFAREKQGKQRSSVWVAAMHAAGAFCKSFVLQRGFLGGAEGLVISVYIANTAFYKYLKLAEANQRRT